MGPPRAFLLNRMFNRTFQRLAIAAFLAMSFGAFGKVKAESSAPEVVGVHRSGRPSKALDRRIDRVLRQSAAQRGFWGIEVIDLATGKVLYSRNSEHLFLPASNMKLFTTAAAIEKLSPDFVFRTTVESETAPDSRGRLKDLFLVGRGDPNLSGRILPYVPNSVRQDRADHVFQELADQVKARGVQEITGNLVADDSYFLWEPFSPNWAADDLQWGYGAPVTALAFNDNALLLRFRPGSKVGDTAQVALEPVSDYYQLNNRLETSGAGSTKRIYVERIPDSMQLDVWGEIPAGCDESETTVAINHPPRLIGEVFRQALEARGIGVRGTVKVKHFTRLEAASMGNPFLNPRARLVLAEHDALPLREEIKVINKESLNLHAEMLLRTLAHELKNYGSLTVGLEVLRDFAAQAGVAHEETFFSDGSGLSREDLISPGAVANLLAYMAHSPNFDAFYNSLPVAGVDGTLADRFLGTPGAGRIHAKTGSVEHVNALSGYMVLPAGKRFVFSIIVNNHPLNDKEGAAAVDHVALAVYEWLLRRKRL
jgi:serine-type D-Ala-D-Ala carboxypeptidase/endopeptidase (penicillin-binding protein 4)